MRKALALLALVGLFALMSVALGSPPTKAKQETKTTICTVAQTDAIHTADTSAVAARDAEARTVEAVTATNEAMTGAQTATIGNALTVSPQTAAPPERLQSVTAKRVARADLKMQHATSVGVPVVPRL